MPKNVCFFDPMLNENIDQFGLSSLLTTLHNELLNNIVNNEGKKESLSL